MKFKQARKILKTHDRQFIDTIKNCNGSAIVLDKQTGIWTLQIFVEKKLPEHADLEGYVYAEGKREKKQFKASAEQTELPSEIIEVGKIKAIALTTDKWRPTVGGISIGHYNISAGTLGAACFKSNGDKLILSNNHVLADCNDADIGDDIYQPGPADGGTVADKIGELDSYVTIVFNDSGSPNDVDAALCDPTSENDLLCEQFSGVAYPLGIETTAAGMEVIKAGRTTGVTEGVISGFTGLLAVGYGMNKTGWFDDQVVVPNSPDFGAPGDSGSVVIDKESGKAVGLLFAGSAYYTYLNRMTEVADALGIDFDEGPDAAVSAEATVSVVEEKPALKTATASVSAEATVAVVEEKKTLKTETASVSAEATVAAVAPFAGPPTSAAASVSAEVTVTADEKGYSHYGPHEGRGSHRIANDSLERYELYRGIDAEPDFDAAPFETFTSLPHETGDITS